MSTLAFYFRYAVRSILRSGQRGVLAVACVAFGVFSLVSLQLLAESVERAVLVDPVIELGGDLRLTREGAPLSPADLGALADDPDVSAMETRGDVPARFVQTVDDARIVFFYRVMAVDPGAFPLVGEVRLQDGALAEALDEPGSVVLTRDLAMRLDVRVGDQIRLAGSPGATPARLTIGGVADMVPDAQGGTLLISHETAATITGEILLTTALVRTEAPDEVAARAEAAGWTVQRPETETDIVEDLFGLALPAAGLLGLLIGGIGVANTLQVVLRRRRPEVAVLKTLGYRQRDLFALFGLETALLGLIGGVLGVVLGVAGAEGLRQIMSRSLPMLLDLQVAPSVLIGGLAAGVVTAVLFGLLAITRASAVRPGSLLRQTPIKTTGRTRLATLGLSVLLFALFGALGGLLIGSALHGLAVIAAGVAGLVVFGAIMVAVLLIVVRLPTPGLPLVGMAAANLRRHPARASASLVALFVGTFAIGVSSLIILNARQEVVSRTVEAGGVTLAAYGIPADDPEVVRLAEGAPVWTDRSAEAEVLGPDGEVLWLSGVIGRGADGASTVEVADEPRGERGRAWLSDPNRALVPWSLGVREERPVQVGDSVTVRVGETERAFAVDGYYDRPDGIPLVSTMGLLILPEAFDSLATESGAEVTQTVAVEAPQERAEALASALGEARPDGAVVTAEQVADMFTGVVRSLFILVLALTSLALLAGTVLIANGVGLALVERRRELGVLKAVGYTAGQVLRVLVLENALLGIVGGGLGVAAAVATMAVIEITAETDLALYPGVSVLLVGVSVALAAGSALLVAARPVRQRPLEVLRSD
ncbi:MAG: FtsX-like permease family protein [Bacteroidota bacterium]